MDEAIDALAERSVALRNGAPRLEKQAMEKTALLQQVGDWFKNLSPLQQKALIGGAGGAAVGLGSGLLRDKEERRPLGSTLTGALAGTAAGLGYGMATSPAAVSPPAAGAKPELPEGQFYHPKTGKPLALKPGVTGEQAQQLADLQDAGYTRGTLNKVIGKGFGGVADAFPLTTTAGAGLAGLGGLGLGGKLFNWEPKVLGGIQPWAGRIEAAESRDPRHLQKAMSTMTGREDLYGKTGVPGGDKQVETTTSTTGRSEVIEKGDPKQGRGKSITQDTFPDRTATSIETVIKKPADRIAVDAMLDKIGRNRNNPERLRQIISEAHAQGGKVREVMMELQSKGAMSEVGKRVSEVHGPTATLRPSVMHQTGENLRGIAGWLSKARVDKNTGQAKPIGKVKQLLQRFAKSTNKSTPYVNVSSTAGKWRGRGKLAAILGLPFMADILASQPMKTRSRQNQFEELVKRYAEPVPKQ